MIEPFDKITEDEQELLKRYIRAYTDVEISDLKTTLNCWNKNKRTLFRALGKELRVAIPVTIERNRYQFDQALGQIYTPWTIYDNYDIRSIRSDCERDGFDHSYMYYYHNEFVARAVKHMVDNYGDSIVTIRNFTKMFSYTNIEEGKTVKDYNFPALNFEVKKGTKIAKAIQRTLKKANFTDMESFEKWRNAISNLNSNRSFKANLVISIHPMDYMTMSDNNCDWSSCMSWRNNGAYSIGTIEMMNSNVAAVAYLESDTPFEICDMTAPNKSWRTLVFIHKDILLIGKNYPYTAENINRAVLEEVMKLVKHNLNWDYEWKFQPYSDTYRFASNYFVKHSLSRYKMRYTKSKENRHKIICYTDLMYNDILEDPSKSKYLCCRNKPKRTKFINLSGPATCMCCGEHIYDRQWASPNDEDCSRKVCMSCESDRRCDVCGRIYQNGSEEVYKLPGGHRYQNLTVCKDDLHEVLYVPAHNCFVTRNNIKKEALLEISDNIEDINYSPTWDRETPYGKKYVVVPYWFIHRFNKAYLGWMWDDIYSSENINTFLRKNNITLLDLLNTTKTRMAKSMEDIDAYCCPLCD